METTIDKKRIVIMVLLIICILLISQLFSKCESQKVQLANIDALNKELTTYQLKNGQLVTSVENLNYTNEQLKKNVLMKDKKVKELTDKFSHIKSITKYVTNTKFDTIKLVYNDSIPCNFERIGSDLKQWYHIAYKSNQKGVEITELSIPDSVIVATGDKRKWFWGKRTSVTDITHANPFVETESIQHIEVVQPTKWYDSTVLKIAIGFIGGVFLLK
jgi:cell division protein FtsB